MTPPTRPGDGADVIDELAAALGARRSLLAIDNCEHVIDAVAELAAGITARCPNTSVLATSPRTARRCPTNVSLRSGRSRYPNGETPHRTSSRKSTRSGSSSAAPATPAASCA